MMATLGTSTRPGAPRPAALWVGISRISSGGLVLATLAVVYALNVVGGDPRFENTFGYFTNLTSLFASLVILTAGIATLRGRPSGRPLAIARAAAASCLVIVGLVYNLLVPGTGTAPPWASVILHLVFPVLALLDWLLVTDRPRLAWREIWWVLPYPIVWLAATLIRGVTEGWVPYGFLLPSRGTTAILWTSTGLLAALLAAAALVWAGQRTSRAGLDSMGD
ncbi:Pr6Pr family membrane protein [Leucobacter sp. 7(1)]|uniref:Pr6Pr family membrane protein n=1 Tax=Leucobacter sp. 7(1) TaxID=1255613 RepID=UPI0020CF4E50|nr:Pr6Pr family membrane protein [Leucobacter sp. 7(1)]